MSPIALNKYTWTQTDSILTVNVLFNGKLLPVSSKLDMTTTNDYVKISSPPYQLELFLANEINNNNSSCIIAEDKIILQLHKIKLGEWPCLEMLLSGKEKVEKRKQVTLWLQEENQRCIQERKELKHSLKQAAVKEQMDLDSRQKSAVDEIKTNEKTKMSQSLEGLKSTADTERNELTATVVTTCNQDKSLVQSRKSKQLEHFPVPLVRQTGVITVSFSDRVFPTPSRESLLKDENDYLTKQLAARRATGFASEDLRPEECNPMWLKNKGDSFYKSKNYLGAISAYTHALKVGSKMPEIFSNRAACHFQLGNLHKSLEDTTTALELLTPPVNANKDARAKCHARRAVVLCRLGLPEKSLPEFEEALKLHPDDGQLRAAYEQAKEQDAQNQDSDSS